MSEYLPRVADHELSDKLRRAAAVLIEGPKACGKTWTARRMAKSQVLLDVDEAARRSVVLDPQIVLQGDAPRLLDEWQVAPEIWNHVRHASDLHSGVGRFILTGSAVPVDDLIRHSGVGRITRLRMRTMSLFEQGGSSGEISLRDLLTSARVSAPAPAMDMPGLVEIICRGGWPRSHRWRFERAIAYVRDYVDQVRRTDIGRGNGSRHNPNAVLRLMRSLARSTATQVSVATLARDVGGGEEGMEMGVGSIKAQTLSEYLRALERIFVIENQEPFAPHLRSRARLRRAPKRHFVDPSIAVAVLRAAPDAIRRDPQFLGQLFESLVVRDLRIYAAHNDAEVYHYRDNTDLEIDAIVQTVSGRWMPIEVKLGGGESVDQAARNLLKFRQRIDTDRAGAPAKLVVITASGYAAERPDGVSIVPIGCLGP